MKKIASFLVAILLLMSLTGCAKDPKEQFLEATEKTNALEHHHVEGTVNVSLMGMEIEAPIVSRVIMKDGKQVASYAEVEFMGTKMINTYVDGMMYTDSLGVKMKYAATPEEIAATSGINLEKLEFDEESLYSVQAGEKDADGNKTYIVDIDEETVNELIKSVMDEIMADTLKDVQPGSPESDMLESMNTEITEFSYIASVNSDGYLCKIDMDMSIKVGMEGFTITADIGGVMDYKNIGEEFEITAPEDADAYTEYDIDDLPADYELGNMQTA